MVKEVADHKQVIQLDVHEEKSYMTKLQLENDQLLAEKISYLDIINEKEAVIASLRDQKLAQELQSEEDKEEKKEDETNVFLNSVKECAPTILEKNSFPLLEFKKPFYNEELTDEIAKLLPNLKVTPAIAQTIQYLMKHDPTKFNFKEDRECAQQPKKS
ncbi:unnamed protein product [Prunus brigantina]